jgi:putative CRISPR-associated protein (TIGR02619 family)
MTVVVTPVGTSLFDNGSRNNSRIGDYYEAIKECPESEWENYSSYIEVLREESTGFIKEAKASASAELQSIAKIQAELNDDIEVRLLASDTVASRLAAEILTDKISRSILGNQVKKVEFDPEIDIIRGLQVKSTKDFSDRGMPNLMRRISQLDGRLAINITGGYKATVPYLTILGQIDQIPLFYTFEDSEEESPDLIKIPQVPLNVDWQLIKYYANELSKIDDGVSNWQEFQQQYDLAVEDLRGCIEVADDIAAFSWFGERFWKCYRNTYLVEINAKSYFSYSKVWHDIDIAIRNLYGLLSEALSGSKAFAEPECFEAIASLSSQGNVNHGGPINSSTFIFKSQRKRLPLRFAYSFKVNGKEITSITIFELVREPFNHKTYVREFREKYRNPGSIDFVTLTLPKATQ